MPGQTPRVTDGAIFKGALVAPLAAPIATLLIGPLLDSDISLLAAPIIFVAAIPLAYLATLIIGLPYAFLLRRLGRLTVVPCVAGAFAITLVIGAIIGRNLPATADHGAWRLAALASLIAAVVAGVWCLVAAIPWRSGSRY